MPTNSSEALAYRQTDNAHADRNGLGYGETAGAPDVGLRYVADGVVVPFDRGFEPTARTPAAVSSRTDARVVFARVAVAVAGILLTGLCLFEWTSFCEFLLAAIIAPSATGVALHWSLHAFAVLFFVGSFLPFVLFVGWRAVALTRQPMRQPPPFVSIIIPAFNEEDTISRCLAAAATQDYPNFEVIVVNDGSTDLTMPLIEQNPVVFVQAPKNRGKAAAVNEGIKLAKGEIVVFSDSDSWLHPQALNYLVRHFHDPRVGATAGTVTIADTNSLIRCWQQIEYLFGQFVMKLAQNGSGASITVCPGPVCAFRAEVLAEAGGFTDRTITEDFDMTLEVIRSGRLAIYEPRAIAYTKAPATWGQLRHQRMRWSRGILQGLLLHRDLMFSARAGVTGMVWLPYIFFFGYVGCLLEVALLISMPAMIFFGGAAPMFGLMLVVLPVLLLFHWLQYVTALGFAGEMRSQLVLAALIIQPYEIFLAVVRTAAIGAELLGGKAKW